jgi:hypothetical protein
MEKELKDIIEVLDYRPRVVTITNTEEKVFVYKYAKILQKYMINNNYVSYNYYEKYFDYLYKFGYTLNENDTDIGNFYKTAYDILTRDEKNMELFKIKHLINILGNIHDFPSVKYCLVCDILNNEKLYNYLLNQTHNIENWEFELLTRINEIYHKKYKSEKLKILDKVYNLILYKSTNIDTLSIIASKYSYDDFIEYSINNKIILPIECINIYFCQKRYDIIHDLIEHTDKKVIDECFLEIASFIPDPDGIEYVFKRIPKISDECIQRCNFFFNKENEFLGSLEKHYYTVQYTSEIEINNIINAKKILSKEIGIEQKYKKYKYLVLSKYTQYKKRHKCHIVTKCESKIKKYNKLKDTCVEIFKKYGYNLINMKQYY